jgi:betaine-aldehyde dehydrogenase
MLFPVGIRIKKKKLPLPSMEHHPASSPFSTVEGMMAQLSGQHYIDGDWCPGEGGPTAVINPATERGTGHFHHAVTAEIERAIQAAQRAQGQWWQLSALDRAEALHRVADQLIALSARIGECLTREMGKPFRESNSEGIASIGAFRHYAELARHDQGRIAGPAITGQLHMTIKEPLGTVVTILPFNYPVVLFSWQAAAALAAGNAVIAKPSELTPLTLLLLMEAFRHLPAGLVQVLNGGPEVGEALVAHPLTHGIAFTGSVRAAQAVARTAAERFKPLLIEASGNDPFLVMPSACIDTAARAAAYAAFVNCGQVCTSAERFYVHEAIYEPFIAALAERARELRIGNGLERVDLGPLASERERSRVEAIVASAIAEGARLVCGGRRPPRLSAGWFYEPTVLEVKHDHAIMHGECFGPLAPVARVASLEEAMTKANDSDLGLGANIFTNDLEEAFAAIHGIQSGVVWVNTPLNDNDAVPFGGRKLTGIGRELGIEGLEQFRRPKMVMIAPKAEAHPEWFPYSD